MKMLSAHRFITAVAEAADLHVLRNDEGCAVCFNSMTDEQRRLGRWLRRMGAQESGAQACAPTRARAMIRRAWNE